MKQSYVKPRIIIERFALTQSIAAGCGAITGGNTLGGPTSGSVNTCVWDMINYALFVTTNNNCDPVYAVEPDENVLVNGYCYNNPEGGTAVFSSF